MRGGEPGGEEEEEQERGGGGGGGGGQKHGERGGGWVEAGRTRPRPRPGEGHRSQVTGHRPGGSYQGLSRQDLQQGDEVVSIAEVLVQVRDVPLGLRTQQEMPLNLFPLFFPRN